MDKLHVSMIPGALAKLQRLYQRWTIRQDTSPLFDWRCAHLVLRGHSKRAEVELHFDNARDRSDQFENFRIPTGRTHRMLQREIP